MEKLKGTLELLRFHNVWVSDGKIFCKLEGNDIHNCTMATLFWASEGKCWVRWKEKNWSRHGDIYGVIYENILLVVSVFMFFVLCFILFNDNAPLIYCFAFLFLKFSFYSTFVKRAILKFDIYCTSFMNCKPKVLLVISDILMSQLVFYLFNIGHTAINLSLV